MFRSRYCEQGNSLIGVVHCGKLTKLPSQWYQNSLQLWAWIANAGPSIGRCWGQLWRKRAVVCARVWFCVGVCLSLSVNLTSEWRTMMMRTRLCSDDWGLNNEFPYRSGALWLTSKIDPAKLSEQLAKKEQVVQLDCIWGKNELLQGLGSWLSDHVLSLIRPKGAQGRLRQFRSSILGAFWDTFWKILRTKTAFKDELCFRYILCLET